MSSDTSTQVPVKPLAKEFIGSINSIKFGTYNIGESSVPELPPSLIPVYNGQVLKINSDLLHEGLSGISIKHYYGKCPNEIEEIENSINCDGIWDDNIDEREEMYECELFESSNRLGFSLNWRINMKSSTILRSDTNAKDNTDNSENPNDFLPECVKQRINRRNSFWNLHRPELCKLTWPQKYVSRVTVMAFLHKHLISHGPYCVDIHTEEDRQNMLYKELTDFGKLKILVFPKEIPPDEKRINLKEITTPSSNRCKILRPKCTIFQKKLPEETEELGIQFSDDELSRERSLRRSNEEFCLTIGRYIQKPAIKKSVSEIEEIYGEQDISYNVVEEESSFYFYNWLKNTEKECYDEEDTDASTIDFEPIITGTLPEPCPVLGANDFCRTVAKADFSDLRCHPDDF